MTERPSQFAPYPCVGHETLIQQLVEGLRTERRANLLASPGLGASRVAYEVAQALRTESSRSPQSVVTLNAQDELHWTRDLLQIANTAGLRERHLRKIQDLLPAVRAWLRTHEHVLVIDRLNNFEMVQPLLNGLDRSQVLLISETDESVPDDWGPPRQLTELNFEERTFILMNVLELHSLEQAEQDQLQALTERCGHLPQLLMTLGATIRHGLSLADALTQFDSLKTELNSTDPAEIVFHLASSRITRPCQEILACIAIADGDPQDLADVTLLEELRQVGLLQQAPLTANWQLPRCFHAISTNQVPLSACLQLTSQISNPGSPLLNGLADRVLSAGQLSAETTDLVESAAEAAFACGAWQRAAALYERLRDFVRETDPQNGLAHAHVLVRLAQCERAGQRFSKSQRALNEALNHVDPASPEAQAVLMDLAEHDINEAQVARALRRIKMVAAIHNKLGYAGENIERARRLFLRGACHLAEQDTESAVRVLERAHSLQNALLPLDHHDVLKTRTLLTRALYAAKDLDRAEAILTEDLLLREASPEVSTSEILVTMNALAELKFHRGKVEDSEELFERVLTLRENFLEADHQLVAETACHIAKLKSAHGAFREADQYFRKAMSIMLERYGSSHPELARVNNDLAESLFTQGKYDQAQRILTRSLRIQESALRPSDPALARTRNNLAAIQVALGSYENAEKLYKRDLEAKRLRTPPSPLSVAMSANNLGEVIRSQGRLDESHAYFEEALTLRQQHLKPDHPLVAQSLVNLGYVYLLKCETAQAEPYFQQAMDIRKQALSPEHPHLASSLNCLAQIRIINEDYAAANQFLAEAEDICRKVYGEEHPQYGNLLSKSGRIQLKLKRKARAELKLLKSKTILEKAVGSNHRFYAEALHGIGELRQSEGETQEAFPMLERALAILQETTHGPRFEIGELQFLIGQNLLQRGEIRSARERFEQCVEIWRQLLGTESTRVIAVELELGQTLVAMHECEAAERCLAHVAASPHIQNWELSKRVALVAARADALAGLKQYAAAEGMLVSQLSLLDQQDTSDPRTRLSVYSHLAGVKYLMNDLQGAEPWIVKCVDTSTDIHGADHPETAKHRENLAGLYFANGRAGEAEVLINQAIQTFEQHYGVEHPAYQTAMSNYSKLLRTQNRIADAEKVEQELNDILSRGSHILDF